MGRALRLPPGKRVALLVTVPVEFFPLDMALRPVAPAGALLGRYPDVWGFSNRDYGNRVGLGRIMRILDRLQLRATAFVDQRSAQRYPQLLASLLERNWEIGGSGIDLGHLHFGGLDPTTESGYIRDCLQTLSAASRRPVFGWQSPGLSESAQTLDLLAEHGVRYVADWVNDDCPYDMQTNFGPITALPTSYELSDQNMFDHDFTVDEYVAQCVAAWRCLDGEAATAPRVLALTVTPWILGYPHRIRGLLQLLQPLSSTKPSCRLREANW